MTRDWSPPAASVIPPPSSLAAAEPELELELLISPPVVPLDDVVDDAVDELFSVFTGGGLLLLPLSLLEQPATHANPAATPRPTIKEIGFFNMIRFPFPNLAGESRTGSSPPVYT